MLIIEAIMGPDYYVTPAPQQNGISRKMLFIGGGLIVAVIVAFILLLSSGGKNISSQLQHLSLRQAALQTMLDDTTITRNIRNQDLNKLVTDFSLNLQSDSQQLAPLFTEAGMPAKMDQNILRNEADTSTKGKLEAASLNNQLDRTYAEVLKQKIESIQALLAETLPLVKNSNLKKALKRHDNNLEKTKSQLEKLNL